MGAASADPQVQEELFAAQSRTASLSVRQLFNTERIAAIFATACALPTCIQFHPIATGHMRRLAEPMRA